MAKREASGETAVATNGGEAAGGKVAAKRSRRESTSLAPGAADPGAGPRLATGDLPVVEMGGGAAAGAILGRLLGGGKGALLGAAVGAAAGTALGMATGGMLRRREEGAGSREPAFGPAGRARPGAEAPAAAPAKGTAKGGARKSTEANARSRTTSAAAQKKAPEAASKETPEPASKRSRDYESWTKADLYEEAKRRGIAGRSTMGKAELIQALRAD